MSHHEAWLRAYLFRFKKVFRAAMRHTPWLLRVIVTIALLIPGPQDEILVGVILAFWAMRPGRKGRAMRRDIAGSWRHELWP